MKEEAREREKNLERRHTEETQRERAEEKRHSGKKHRKEYSSKHQGIQKKSTKTPSNSVKSDLSLKPDKSSKLQMNIIYFGHSHTSDNTSYIQRYPKQS